MGRTLIICEKPTAAGKIASALATKRPSKQELNGVPYYEFERDGKEMIVVPALGHLFTLKNLKPMHDYPFYDIDWVPTYEANRRAERARAFAEAIRELAKDADNFIGACDFDIEGEVIGFNALRFLCGEDSVRKAKRMKFSALTAQDLQQAYENILPHLSFEMVDSGIARHFLDWYWGMNTSKALSSSVEAAHERFAKLSAGRVQSPALKILAEREGEIKAFKPEPFWVVGLLLELEGQELKAEHAVPRFTDEAEAERVRNVCQGKPARVSAIQTRQYRQPPPVPFDLGLLQSEAYRCFGYTPMRTQQLAQNLYLAGLITYPRTSSQKLPPTINFTQIIKHLGEISKQYKKLADSLLALPELKPNEGAKVDPAHPSVHPTGEKPEKLTGPQQKLYDLIVRRFFSIFGKPALKEGIRVELDIEGQKFYLRGRRILEEGWLAYYGNYGATEEITLPELSEGRTLMPKQVLFEEKETQPPPRYNPSSIVKEMERLNLGTKCLRGDVPVLTSNFRTIIIQELYENSHPWKNQGGLLSATSPQKSLKALNTRFSGESLDQIPRRSSRVTCLAFNPNSLEVTKKPVESSRRETELGEEILSIQTKYGSIEVTSDHPIFAVHGDKIACKRAAEIKVGDKLLAYIPRSQASGKQVKLEGTDFIYGLSKGLEKEVAAKRKELGLSQAQLAHSLDVSQSTIHAYEDRFKVPISILAKLGITPQFVTGRSSSKVIPNPFPVQMSSSLARLLGRLTGDGSFGRSQFAKENSCDFRYFNTEPSMVQSFLQDVMAVFKTMPKVSSTDRGKRRRIYRTKLPGVVGRILIGIAPETTMHQVPKIVLSDRQFWMDYLSALFDDEATVPTGELKLRFTQKNKRLISQITFMLNELGIQTGQLHLENGSWNFGIYGRRNIERFLLRVGLTHPAKLQRLLASARKRPSIQKKAMVYCLVSKGLKPAAIARELKYPVSLVRRYLRELFLDGLIDRLRKSLGHGRGSVSKYVVKVPFGATFYALLDAAIVTHQLCSKPVHAIKREETPEFVFDLSIDEKSPAFVAGIDNIIVHNSTRAPIVQTLYDRGYIFGNQITVTELGVEVVGALGKYCPEIVSEELTSHFEKEMEAIREGNRNKDEVIAKARAELDKILRKFKKHQLEIGKDLGDAYRRTKQRQKTLGTCSKCGGQLKVIVSRRTHKRFAGCSNYSKGCRNSFPLPQAGFIIPMEKTCEQCGTPMIQVNRQGMRPYRMCIDPKCPSKKDWGKKKAKAPRRKEVESSGSL